LRARFYGALEEMLFVAIEYTKHARDGGWLAYEMLKHGGVIPDAKQERTREVTPEEEQTAIKRIAIAMAEGAIERSKFFEMPLPEVDELEAKLNVKARRDLRRAEKERL
jgi:hypothetical protein